MNDEIRFLQIRIRELEDALKVSHDVVVETLSLLENSRNSPGAVARLTERLAKVEAMIGSQQQSDLEP